MSSTSRETSQYLNTPIKDWYLDIWVPRDFISRATDRLYIIPPEYERRPDLLSYEVYGTPRLWWLIAQRNKDVLIDPLADFLPGVKIYIPENILR